MSNTGKKKCYNCYQFVSFHDSDVASELPWFDAKKKKKMVHFITLILIFLLFYCYIVKMMQITLKLVCEL